MRPNVRCAHAVTHAFVAVIVTLVTLASATQPVAADADAPAAVDDGRRNSTDGTDMHVVYPWEANYAPWRRRDSVSFVDWRKRIRVPVQRAFNRDTWEAMATVEKEWQFGRCMDEQASGFASGIPGYASPSLDEVRRHVDDILEERGAHVVVAVFWGRQR